MSMFRNFDCLSLVVCSNTTLLKLQTVLFLSFSKLTVLRNRRCGLCMDAAYTRTFTVVYSGWFPLTGLPWPPPCLSRKCLSGAPCQPSRHQFPSSSIGDEFKQKLTDLITQASKAFLFLHKTDLPLVIMPT